MKPISDLHLEQILSISEKVVATVIVFIVISKLLCIRPHRTVKQNNQNIVSYFGKFCQISLAMFHLQYNQVPKLYCGWWHLRCLLKLSCVRQLISQEQSFTITGSKICIGVCGTQNVWLSFLFNRYPSNIALLSGQTLYLLVPGSEFAVGLWN